MSFGFFSGERQKELLYSRIVPGKKITNNTQKAKAQQIKTYISPHLLLFATSQFKNSEVELV